MYSIQDIQLFLRLLDNTFDITLNCDASSPTREELLQTKYPPSDVGRTYDYDKEQLVDLYLRLTSTIADCNNAQQVLVSIPIRTKGV